VQVPLAKKLNAVARFHHHLGGHSEHQSNVARVIKTLQNILLSTKHLEENTTMNFNVKSVCLLLISLFFRQTKQYRCSYITTAKF